MKKYSSKDLFNGSLFGEAIKEAKDFLMVLKEVQNEFREYGKTAEKRIIQTNELTSEGMEEVNREVKEGNKNLEAYNKTVEQQIKVEKELTKLQKEEIKLKERLLEGSSEQAKVNEQLKVQIAAQNKQRKDAAKLATGQISQYQKESKRLRELKNEYRDLALANKETTEEGQDLLKNIIKLDKELKDLDATVGDSFRNVGNYEDALGGLENQVKGLDKTLKATGIVLILTQAVGIAQDFFGRSREASLETEKAFARFSETVKVFISSAIASFGGVKDVIVGVFNNISDNISNFVTNIQIATAETKLFFLELTDNLPGVDVSKQIDNVNKSIEGLNKSFKDTSENSNLISKGIVAIEEAFEGDENTISNAIDVRLKLLEVTQDLSITNLSLTRSLSELITEQDRLSTIFEDDTRSFEDRNKALEGLLNVNEKVSKQQKEIAANELEIARINVASDLAIAGILDKKEALALTDSDLLMLLNDRNTALKVSDEAEQAYTDAFITYSEARQNAQNTEFSIEKERRKLASDQLERDLDILIDNVDNQKTINERLIDNAKLNLDERQRILNDTNKIFDESFSRQQNVISKFAKIQIESDSQISESERKRRLEKLESININELVAEQDSEIVRQRIRELGLSEIFEGRLLEVIRDRRTGIQDLQDAQESLNESTKESNKIDQDSISNIEEIIALQKARNSNEVEKAEAESQKKRRDQRLESIQEELELVKEGSEEEIELYNEQTELLLDAERERAAERISLQEQTAEELREIEDAVYTFLGNQLDAYYDRRQARIQKDLDSSVEAENRLLEAQQEGVQFSEESVAEERRRQAELEQEQLRLEEQQARRELVLASLQAYRANDGNLSKTFTDIIALREFANNIPLFYDGTEDTGAGGNVDNKGGFHAILHPHERVLTAAQNEVIGDLSNDDLTSVAQMYNTGGFINNEIKIPDYGEKLEDLKNEIKMLPKRMPVPEFRYDQVNKMIIDTVKYPGKTVNKKYKANRLF